MKLSPCLRAMLVLATPAVALSQEQPAEPEYLWRIDQLSDETFALPTGLAADPAHGQIYVADQWGPHVYALEARTGRLIRRIGRKGDGPGEFQAPAVAAVSSSGLLAVLDILGRRIEIFDHRGEFVKRFPTYGILIEPKGMGLRDDTTVVVAGGYNDAAEDRPYPGVHWFAPGYRGARSTPPDAPPGRVRARRIVAGGPIMMLDTARAVIAEAATGDVWVGDSDGARRVVQGPGAVEDLMERMVQVGDQRTTFWWTFTRAVLVDTLPAGAYLVGITDFDRDELRFYVLRPAQSPELMATWRARVDYAVPYDSETLIVITDDEGVKQVARARYPQAVRMNQ